MSTTEASRPTASAPPAPPPLERRSLERLWLTITLLGLSLAVFGQSAGNVAADTKIDLVVSPLRFLGRALHLWDPIGNAGQLQNQAYGYLFPIGPFYAGLHALGIPAWELQRAFESAVVGFAFAGTYRLARRLGIDSFWPAWGAGLAYALAPRVLSELTSISAELMPVAALPWVLIPLVDGAAGGGSPRRAAARSGLALLFAGGVNAGATVAILPVPFLWLVTRSSGARRRALLGWWSAAVACACAWWAIPLVLLGRYSPPFLDWVESSSTTTLPTSLLAVLRGVDHWEGYLGPGIWPGGWVLVSGRAAIVATSAVAAVGLIGVARRGVRHRTFLWSSLLLGLVVLTLGHAAQIGPPGSAAMRHLLDGVLVPFRNLHKFDPLVRLPIALGVGHLLLRLSTLPDRVVRVGGAPLRLPVRRFAAGLVAAVGAVAIAPVWTNHLVSLQRVSPDASWWSATAKWLGGHSHGARALVVPGSASPSFVWGSTVDDPIQPLAHSPWTVRGAVPLAQAGYIRLLESVEAILAAGEGDARLAPLLARAGIGYVVVANDLNTVQSQATPLLYLHATVDESPGLQLRASFGQKVGGSLSPALSIDAGASVARSAVEIYSVDGWAGRATMKPLSAAVAATGSSDSLPQLIGAGLGAGQAVLFGADGDGTPVGTSVTTDGIRRQEAPFAGSLTPSATLTEQQPYTQERPAHDYLPSDPGLLSAYRYEGIADVTASSSGADQFAYLNRSQHNGPWSALDGDPTSSWQSTGFAAPGQWLQVRFVRAITAPTAMITFGSVDDGPAPLPTRVAVTTDAGTLVEPVLPITVAQPLRLPNGPTTRLRVTVVGVADPEGSTSVAISSLTVPGVDPVRTLVVPSRPDSDAFTFSTADGRRNPCLTASVGTVCDDTYQSAGQEDSGIDRQVTTPAGDWVPTATVRLTGSPTLDAALDAGNPIRATASSVASSDPRLRAGAAVDGDLRTIWQAMPGDINPVLTLRPSAPRDVAGLTVRTPIDAPVAAPLAVTVTASGPDGTAAWTGNLPADGHVVLDHPVRADMITIWIDLATVRRSANSITGAARLLPVGIADVRLDGPAAAVPGATVHLPCGSGPVVLVDGTPVPMQVDALRADVLAGRPVPATPCVQPSIRLTAGSHRLSLGADADTGPATLTLTRVGFRLAEDSVPATSPPIEHWGPTERSVRVDTAAAALLVVPENANAGWEATLGGHRLRSVRVDGWQQGYLVPAGSRGTVQLVFAPQRTFVGGLVAGGLAILVLFGLRWWRPRGRDILPLLRDARPTIALAAVALVGVAWLLSGWAGLLVGAAVGLAGALIGGSVRRWAPLVAGALLIGAGLAVARAGPTQIFVQQNSGQVQLLCVTALAIGGLTGFARRRSRRDE